MDTGRANHLCAARRRRVDVSSGRRWSTSRHHDVEQEGWRNCAWLAAGTAKWRSRLHGVPEGPRCTSGNVVCVKRARVEARAGAGSGRVRSDRSSGLQLSRRSVCGSVRQRRADAARCARFACARDSVLWRIRSARARELRRFTERHAGMAAGERRGPAKRARAGGFPRRCRAARRAA